MFKRLFAPLVMAGLIMSGQALAHAKLEKTEPADGSTVSSPKTVMLTFGDPVVITALKVTHDGKTMELKSGGNTPSSTITAPLATMTPGQYSVFWSAVSEEDGHAMKGTFSFTVTGK